MGFNIQDGILKSYEGRDYELFLPDYVTEIESRAFSHKKLLRTIHLGSCVKEIGHSAFSGCEVLEAIEIPQSVVYIGDHCFSDCTTLERVVIPEGVTRIENSTFYGCSSLHEVFLPSTIEYIGETAFNNCKNLVNIHFKSLPTKIEHNAFNGCSRLYEDTGMVIIGETIYGYSGKDGVLKIPPTVNCIADEAFWNNKELVEVEIPRSIKVIPLRAFKDCENLKTIRLNDGLQTIGWIAFDGCKSIEEIIIPESVTNIGPSVFQGCRNLKYVKLPSTLTSISESMFSGCRSLEDIELPNSVKNIMRDAFSFAGIREIDLSNVEFIDMHAFYGSKIKRFVLGENFKTPYSHMLGRCFELKYLYISDSVTEVEGWSPEFAEQTEIPFIHVSSKLIKGLDDENKLNAVSTFIQTQGEYSDEGLKSWLLHIKRYKVNLLKMCIDRGRDELFDEILNMVALSESNIAEIKQYIKGRFTEDVEQSYNDKLVPTASVTKRSIKKASGTIISQLIDSIPKSASAVKKVYLLEAVTLFGSYEELLTMIEKYQSFEFTKGAAFIAFQTKQLEKLDVVLGLHKYFGNGNYSSLKGKYGDFVDARFEDVITKATNGDLYNLDVIKNFIRNTIGTLDSAIEVNYGTCETTRMLQELVAHPNVVNSSSLLHRAIINQNFSIVYDLLAIGCRIDFGRIPQDTGYCLSRMIPTLEVEHALLVLKQYIAPEGFEKIRLDDSAIYVDGTSFSNLDVFAMVCSGYNINRFTKKKLLDFAVSLPNATNLQYLLDNGHVRATKSLILSAIESAQKIKNSVTEQWLIRFYENKYGDIVAANEKAVSQTPLQRIKKEWSYTVVDDEVYISSYKGNCKTVIVPSSISGKPVTKICVDAFSPDAPRIGAERKQQRDDIEQIVLPTGFSGFYSRDWCCDSTEFGENFKRFVIPEASCDYSYELLGELLNIAIVENITGAGEFVELDGVVYNKDYTVIIGTIKSCQVNKYVMPASVKAIVKNLWNGFNDLEDLTITSHIQVYDGENSYTKLSRQLGNIKKLKRVTVSGMDVFPRDLLGYRTAIEEVVICEGVKKIEELAFAHCKSLRKLTIPRSCTEIGDYIFPRRYEKNRYGESRDIGISEDFMLYCYEGSYAEQYAREENAPFTYIKEDEPI